MKTMTTQPKEGCEMSAQAKAKEAQGYEDKPEPSICSACRHFASEKILPKWMQGNTSFSGRAYTAEIDGREGKIRCGLGGFAVKKTATCKKFERREK